ncbi:MAG TPA: RNA polymerase sigma factor SigZ [Tepidisphaeraceae bacterium]|nr:RNA polymerase sigma factor SigZ [Tepidisphaeraceae bacterium]
MWNEFSERLRREIASRTADPASVDDVLQNVFLKLHQSASGLSEVENVGGWLHQVARNAVIDHYRRQPRAEVPGASIESASSEEEDAALSKTVADAVACMLRGLPSEDERVLTMADMNGVKQKDIAEALGISLSGAKSRVQRVREKLRSLVQECCALEFDRRGRVIACEAKTDGCNCS